MSNDTNDKPKRTYKRKTPAEKIAALEEQIRREKNKLAMEQLENDPVAGRVVSALKNLDLRMKIAKRNIEGHGRGECVSALDRAEQYRRIADDLETAYERDTALSLVADDWRTDLEAYRDGIIDGTIDPQNETMPAAPEEFKNWSETETERLDRIQREAREAQGIKRKADGDTAEDSDDSNETATVDAEVTVDNAEITIGTES